MEKMVILKYHGIRLGTKDDGSPDLLAEYSNGAQINVKIGEYSEPVPMAVALQIKADFGQDAFEIMAEVDVPTTRDEAIEAEAALESGDAVKVAEHLLPQHIDKKEVAVQESELTRTETTDIHVMRRTRKESFDKTVEPVKYTRKALGRMKKAKLVGLFKAYAATSRQVVKPKYSKKMTRNDLISKILEMQG